MSRSRGAEAASSASESTSSTCSQRRWHLLTLATLAGSLSVFVVLLVSLRALQVPSAEVSAVEAFAAWSLARILGSIPITPGGIGIVELSLTAALIGFGGNNAGVVAAVLVFRFLTIVPTLVLGTVAAALWRRLVAGAPARRVTAVHGRPRLSRRLVRAWDSAASTYGQTAGGQRAAAISYRVLFSLVPFVALLVSVLELVLPEGTQESVVSWLVGVASLPDELADSVDAAVEDAGPPASVTGVVALAVLIWGASGMMASVRSAFRAVWGSEAHRPYLRGKLLDVVLVLGAGVLVVTAFGLSLVVQVVTESSSDIAEALGRGESATAGLGALAQLGGSLTLAFLAFSLLYRVVPPVPTRFREVVPGAVVAAVGVQLASAGFSIYLGHFGGFDDVYGPLGARAGVPVAGVRRGHRPAPGRVRRRCLAGDRDRVPPKQATKRRCRFAAASSAPHAGSWFGTAACESGVTSTAWLPTTRTSKSFAGSRRTSLRRSPG